MSEKNQQYDQQNQQSKKQKKKKVKKLKARQPRGFVDRSPNDIRATDKMVAKIREVYERYGFDPIETPMFEYTDCLGKFLPDTDRPNAGVFSVQDDDDQWMSLRYDLTAPLARHVAENFNEIQLPYRTYRNGWVFRNEKPGPGRFRQFMQFDADTIGAPGVQADAEMCMMMADTMEALGVKRGDYVIRVNNRKVLDGLMEAIGLGGDENTERRLNCMRAIDKLDKFGFDGVKLLLGEGRWDGGEKDKGDFTDGVGLPIASIETLCDFLQYDIDKDTDDGNTDRFRSFFQKSEIGKSGADEMKQMLQLVEAAQYQDRVKFDPSCVRGLEYYTGMVYEAELTFAVTNEKGQEVVFGSVGGGGRYDGLVKRFTGQEVPATGFSIGVSRLMTALKNLGKLDTSDSVAPVLVTVMDKDIEALGKYQSFVQQLRGAGIRTEMYQGRLSKFQKQLRYADNRNCPIVIIQGADERENGKLQIKDMVEGKIQAAAIESNEEYRAARVGQFEIAETDLVAEVEKLLAAQKLGRTELGGAE